MQIRNLSYILVMTILTINLNCVSKKKSPANPVDATQKVPEDSKLDEKSLQTHSTKLDCSAHCQLSQERCDELCCINKDNEFALCAEKDGSFIPPSPGSLQACEALCIQKPEEFKSLIAAIANEDFKKIDDGDDDIPSPKTIFNCSIHKAGEYENRALGPGDWVKLHGDAVDVDNNAIAHAEMLIESSDDAAQLVIGSWRAAVLEPGKFRYTGFNPARITLHRTCIQHKCKVGSTSCERA
ncbi:MAG: hypothetical protein KBD78_01660 [Oligoflexales bacterium]|nr:hypothetical protein [Oligoflexales bacterium]